MTEPQAQPTVPQPPPKTGPWGFWATIGWMFAFAIAAIVSSFVAIFFYFLLKGFPESFQQMQSAMAGIETDGDMLWIGEIVQVLAIGGVLILAVFLRKNHPPKEYLALRPFKAKDVGLWALITLVYIAATDGGLYLIGIDPTPVWMEQIIADVICLPCLLAAIVIMAPFLEEFVFRGFVYEGVEKSLGVYPAIVFATVPWALIHLQYEWYYVLVGLGLGVIFCLARIATRSLYVPIILHMMANTVATLEQFIFG